MQLLQDATTAGPMSPHACARAVLDGMPQVMWFIRRQMRGHRPHRMSVPQFRTLVLLDRYPEANLSAVADHLGAALPTASRMVTGLVGKGLVARKGRPGDRRQTSLVLTAKGRTALAGARDETQDAVAAELARWTDDDRHTVTRAMGLLQNAFAATPPPGEPPDRTG